MLKRTLSAFVLVALFAGLALAADPIKVDLQSVKLKPKHEGTSADLLGYNEGESKIFFYVAGTATATVKIPEDGDYTLTIEASCDEAMNEKAKIMIKAGGTVVEKSFELKQTDAKEYTFPAKMKKGEQKIEIEFLNDLYKEGEYDMNFYIHAIKVEAKK